MTSTTTSPGSSKSPTSRRSPAASAARVATARFRSPTPSPVRADTRTRAARTEAPSFSAEATAPSKRALPFEASAPKDGEDNDGSAAPTRPLSASRSALFSAMTWGMRRVWKVARRRSSKEVMPQVASITSTATSASFRAASARWTRRPASSIPGVSTMSTGPAGASSMALRTGSVVVPATSDTTETVWLVSAFTRLDLPALRTPKKTMCARSPEGVSFRDMQAPFVAGLPP